MELIAELSQSLVNGSQLLGLGKEGLALGLHGSFFLSMIRLGGFLALRLQASQNALILPTDLSTQTLQSTEAATRLEADDAKGSGHNHALHRRVRLGDTLKDLHALQGSSTTGGLVRKHATHGAPENLAGGAEVERSLLGISGDLLAKEGVVLELVAEERAGNVQFFAADDDDALARQQLLGNDGCEAPKQVSLSINNYDLFKRH